MDGLDGDLAGSISGGCIEEDFLTHMLEGLSEEDRILVEEKIEELLLEQGLTIEDLDNHENRYLIMDDLMIFMEENELIHDYHYDDFPHHGGRHHGMRR